VRAGATITQSIITQAWVTATQRTGVGLFTNWNALGYDQVNPQKTDGVYPDKVLKPGYYSFLVPSESVAELPVTSSRPGHGLARPATLRRDSIRAAGAEPLPFRT